MRIKERRANMYVLAFWVAAAATCERALRWRKLIFRCAPVAWRYTVLSAAAVVAVVRAERSKAGVIGIGGVRFAIGRACVWYRRLRNWRPACRRPKVTTHLRIATWRK